MGILVSCIILAAAAIAALISSIINLRTSIKAKKELISKVADRLDSILTTEELSKLQHSRPVDFSTIRYRELIMALQGIADELEKNKRKEMLHALKMGEGRFVDDVLSRSLSLKTRN